MEGKLRLKLAELVDISGTSQTDVFEAIVEVFRLRAALQLDPDPAESDSAAVEPSVPRFMRASRKRV
ncbi:hypothetical protein GFL38_32720 [Rhizobium leguminosarum bv. viciae]|nr:hypothetical protein [Rhizobium leguminosarum bv. viciae]NKQ74940.1 hypothetical protein [Rhizobium ruizarguesonis]NKQ82025.1 hypothetical protein [Rhizobium ruizarguesonis]